MWVTGHAQLLCYDISLGYKCFSKTCMRWLHSLCLYLTRTLIFSCSGTLSWFVLNTRAESGLELIPTISHVRSNLPAQFLENIVFAFYIYTRNISQMFLVIQIRGRILNTHMKWNLPASGSRAPLTPRINRWQTEMVSTNSLMVFKLLRAQAPLQKMEWFPGTKYLQVRQFTNSTWTRYSGPETQAPNINLRCMLVWHLKIHKYWPRKMNANLKVWYGLSLHIRTFIGKIFY